MEKVTIIVPVYNMESLVKKCVRSLVNQTYKNIEIILVDDGSMDASGTICDGFAETDKRITVIHQQNGGIGSALNTGLKKMTGDYLLFVDSDDYIAPQMTERLLRLAIKFDADVVQCDRYCFGNIEGMEFQDQPVGEVFVYNNEEAMDDFFHYRRISRNLAARLFRTELFDDIRFEESRQVVDVMTLPLLLQKTRKYVYVAEKYYYVYQSPNSVSRGRYTNQNHDDFMYSLSYFERFINEYYPKHRDYLLYRKTCAVKESYCDICDNDQFVDKKKCLKQCINIYRANYRQFKKTSYYAEYSSFTRLKMLMFYCCPGFFAYFRNRKTN